MIKHSQRAPLIAVSVAFVLALTAASFMAFAPCSVKSQSGTIETRSGSGPGPEARPVRYTAECKSLIQAQGPSVLIALGIPAMLTGAGIAATAIGFRAVNWIAAILLWIFVLLTGFSIGLLFFPAATAHMVAAILQHTKISATTGGTT